MHPPEINDENWFWTVVTGVATGFGALGLVAARFWHGFKEGDKFEEPQGYILEGAELGNMKGLAKAIESLNIKFDAQHTADNALLTLLQTNHELMKEMIMISRRNDAAIARIDQEILVQRRLDEDRRDRRDHARRDGD